MFNCICSALKVVVFFAIAIFVLVDIAEDNPQSLMSLAGLAIYIFLFYITSFNPAKVRGRVESNLEKYLQRAETLRNLFVMDK